MDTQDPNGILDQLQDSVDAQTRFRKQHCHLTDTAGLESIGADLGIQPALEGRLMDFVKSTAKATGSKFSGAFEKLAAWVDSTGSKELRLLTREIQSLSTKGSEPSSRNISDRSLADELQVDGQPVHDHVKHLGDLIKFGHRVTDDLSPDLLAFLGRIYDLVEGSAYVKSADEDDLSTLLNVVLMELAERADPVDWAAANATGKWLGSRQLYTAQEPAKTHPFSKRLDSADARAVIKRWTNRKASLNVRSTLVPAKGTARVGVVPVLELQEMLNLSEALTSLIDQIDRTRKIFSDARRQQNALAVAAFFDSIEQITEYTVVNEVDPTKKDTVTVSNLDEVDRAKIELINRYIGHPSVSPAHVLTSLTQLFVQVRKSYVRYIRTSLKYYR